MRCGIVCAVAAALLLAACGAPGRPVEGATATDMTLGVSFERPRYLVVQGKGELILRNGGNAPVTVETLQLASDWFAVQPPTARSVEVAPGQRIDVPVPYGPARCDVAQARHRAVLDIVGHGQATVPLENGAHAALELVHTEECNRAAVEAAADITVENLQRVGDAPAYPVRGHVVVRRDDSDEAIVVESLRGGVIFSLAPVRAGEPVLALQPHEDVATIPVVFEILRCDPHGMAESKKTYRFPFYIGLGDGEAQYVEVEPSGPARALLEDTLSECANG